MCEAVDLLHQLYQAEYFLDFRRRFLTLLSYNFREFGSVTALSVIEAANTGAKNSEHDQVKRGRPLLIPSVFQVNSRVPDLGAAELNIHLGPFDLKRLESYANNMVDYHVIMDLLPIVSSLHFEKRLGGEVKLGAVQSSILLALGLQRKTIEQVEVSERHSFRHVIDTFEGGVEPPRQPSARIVRQIDTED